MRGCLTCQIGALVDRCPSPGEPNHDRLVAEHRLGQQRPRYDICLVYEPGTGEPEDGHEAARSSSGVVGREARPAHPVAGCLRAHLRASTGVDEEYGHYAGDILEGPGAVQG